MSIRFLVAALAPLFIVLLCGRDEVASSSIAFPSLGAAYASTDCAQTFAAPSVTADELYSVLYERAYSCYARHRYHVALHYISALPEYGAKDRIQKRLAEAVILYHLGDKRAAIARFRSAQQSEATFVSVPLTEVQSPTHSETLIFSGAVKGLFPRLLPFALSFEPVVKEDRTLKAGVAAADSGDYRKSAWLFALAVHNEKSVSAVWLYGVSSYLAHQRGPALDAWSQKILWPNSGMNSQYDGVQWSAVALMIGAIEN